MILSQYNWQHYGFRICAIAIVSILFALCERAGGYALERPGQSLWISVSGSDGSFTIAVKDLAEPILHAGIAAKIDGHWITSSSYPRHSLRQYSGSSFRGATTDWEVVFSGLPGAPELIYHLCSYVDSPFGEVEAIVRNKGTKEIHVQAIRPLESIGGSVLALGGVATQDRVLSDSYSEDVPPIRIRDLMDAGGSMHRGVGSQLVYNRESHWSFFAGALTSDRFITLLRIHLEKDGSSQAIESFEAESTGTTEITSDNSLAESPQEDRIQLSLPVVPGEEMRSERMLLSVSKDYHAQLETYGRYVGQLHKARIAAPNAMGWWSWTAYYYGLSEDTALTNAQWMAQHLSPLGFTYFHLDEGYQYARGEYGTPDATLFPHGVAAFEEKVRALGLVGGLWTAPFEVSERSFVYLDHPDWLVHNGDGKPIPLGWANDHHDRVYALDTTHPDAQQYLHAMYIKLVKDWGIRYLKLDFMDDSAIEGSRYRRNTTAMEAQRIGLDIIRQAVGKDVLLDKDGSTMLNPVGYVDYGRIAQDTGHTFTATKEAAPAVAARYYMNRNFFVNDADAFTVSKQTILDHPWNGGKVPLTFDEAAVSIALSTVAGSMFEIGDDLPTLGTSPERLALVTNEELIRMVQTGRASTPVDLMTYDAADEQPSVFYLNENNRRSVLTIFNWTDRPRTHSIDLSSLGLDPHAHYAVTDVLGGKSVPLSNGYVSTTQPGHSVRMFLLKDSSSRTPTTHLDIIGPSALNAGTAAEFAVQLEKPGNIPPDCFWSFGDGVSSHGATVKHAYTQPGQYSLRLACGGTDGPVVQKQITVDGHIPSVFVPALKKRFVEP